MSHWVDFSEIKSRVTIEQVLRSYRVDWCGAAARSSIAAAARFIRGKGRKLFTRISGRTYFIVLPAVREAMCSTSWLRWKLARFERQRYASVLLWFLAQRASQGKSNWLRKKEQSNHYRWASL